MPFLPHQITRTRWQSDLPMLILTSSPSRGNVVRFFYCKTCSLEGSDYAQPTRRSGKSWFTLRWSVHMNYLEFFYIDLSFFHHLFIYSIIIYIPMDLWIFILFFGAIIQYWFIYFLAQSVPALAIGSSFSWLLCPFDTPDHGVFWTLPYFHDPPGWSCTFQSRT